ncbi:MAG: isocitrate lyase/PEP mutase family protein [Candidatus Angelobacter sp.]
MTQAEKASLLLKLHHRTEPLILINAWDAASACIIEQAGFPAIATSSAAMANALGFADGQKLPWPDMVQSIRRVAEAVKLPVTADIEAGFASSAQHLESSIEQVLAAGAVGINLEDALPTGGEHGQLYDLQQQIERINTARQISARFRIHLVLNARTDAYWQAGIPPDEALQRTMERGQAYLKAGADCIFVPGLRNVAHIKTLLEQWKAPINILAGPGAPSIRELAELGVRRVSFGSGPHRAAMGLLRRIAEEAKTSGTYTTMTQDAVSYDEMNGLFGRQPSPGK